MSFSNECKKAMKQEVPKEVKERAYQSFSQMYKKDSKKKTKKKLLIAGLIAAVIIPTSTMALNNSYFVKPEVKLNDMINDQVKKDAADGKSIQLNEKVVNNGITLHVKEILIQDAKILVYYRFEQQDGSLVPYEFNTTGLDIKSDGKENGKQVESPHYENKKFNAVQYLHFLSNTHIDNYQKDRIGNPDVPEASIFYLTDQTGKSFETVLAAHDEPEGVVVFETLEGEKFPEFLTVNININRIGGTEGTWTTKIPVDMAHKTVQKDSTKNE
ncbi:DUF4179 domain-containing protein [Bacillus albus]|uniref:DUF4179 domain-containing protein n=1 Tax=Bacillus TaxID=1386 RepID=UPI00141953E7|nr:MULTISPECIES: DUF4179 domain-containing protein [Bacillus]MBU5218509.1 DUF4179 domain-containing protein [Bacillus albus]MDA2027976.1 DUF4179 domain-containing protein [Bacillus cereus group sp. Bcc03]MDA2217879.1 DUF4179 domain-containing protein [Bacillus cereus group sp. Bc228]MDA2229451.1 DUF4179 domain-containing protein [Bacillus cereus group sp. Bc227]MDA2260827.1 DUF4179 domain-containing protein [Bacillus cereus group sp. Bc200]